MSERLTQPGINAARPMETRGATPAVLVEHQAPNRELTPGLPERFAVKDVVKSANGSAHNVVKGLVPFAEPHAVSVPQKFDSAVAIVKLGETSSLVVNLTDQDNPHVFLRERDPDKNARDPKSYRVTPLLDLNAALSADEKSITFTPPVDKVTQTPRIEVTAKGAKEIDDFRPETSFAELADDSTDPADLLRNIVPTKVLSKGKDVETVGEDYLQVNFGKDVTLVIDLNPAEGQPRGLVVVDNKNGTTEYTLDNRTILEEKYGSRDSVLFQPSDEDKKEAHAHQIKLTSSGVKQMKRADEARLAEVQLTNVGRDVIVPVIKDDDYIEPDPNSEDAVPFAPVAGPEGNFDHSKVNGTFHGINGRGDSKTIFADTAAIFGRGATYDAKAATTHANMESSSIDLIKPLKRKQAVATK